MKYLVSGGHITPAVAFIKIAQLEGDEVVVVGREYAKTQVSTISNEEATAQELGCRFIPLSSVKYDRYNKLSSILSLWKIIFTTLTAIRLVKTEKPDCIVSFGSFVGLPLCLAGYFTKIPVVIHEQTAAAGLANQIVGKFAARIALSYESSYKYFPKKKSVVTGNLIREEIWQEQPRPQWLTPRLTKPLLLITGGSQGSHLINQVVLLVIETLLESFTVVLQTGNSQAFADFDKAINRREQLAPRLRNHFYVKNMLSAHEFGFLLQHATLVLSRSGGNTVSEIMSCGVPAVLVPLFGSQNSEQEKNARFITDNKAGIMLKQVDFTPQSLLSAVETIHKHLDTYTKRAKKLTKFTNPNSAKHFYALVKSLLE